LGKYDAKKAASIAAKITTSEIDVEIKSILKNLLT
jgi:hypothetical protein